jgi:hypothetical protein
MNLGKLEEPDIALPLFTYRPSARTVGIYAVEEVH